MSRKDPNPLASACSLAERLKSKSRGRRQAAARLAAPGAATRARDILPSLVIENLPLEGLRSARRKVRKADPVHVREVAATMAALGFCVPVLIGRNNVVIDGEVRLEAARLLGLAHALCVRIEHLSDEEQHLLRLAVNRLGEKGEWNLDELKIEFEELILSDTPIEIRDSASMKSITSCSMRSRMRWKRGRSLRRPARSQSPARGTSSSSASTASLAAMRPILRSTARCSRATRRRASS